MTRLRSTSHVFDTFHVFDTVAVLVVVLLLAVSGGAKIVMLASANAATALLPSWLLLLVAAWESALAVLLVFLRSAWVRWATSLSGVAMLVITLCFVMAGQRVASCGCFGTAHLSTGAHALFALALAVLPIVHAAPPTSLASGIQLGPSGQPHS